MTLVITELSDLGIAMAADSAVTERYGNRYRVLTGAVKLQAIPYLNAGISVWGKGSVPVNAMDVSSDLWLMDFIQRHTHLTSLESFAKALEEELRVNFGNQPGNEATMGFHLAGFTETQDGRLPDFWHIHDGPSEVVANIDPTQFNANHDRPPQEFTAREPRYLTHNGDYQFYDLFLKGMEIVYQIAEDSLGFPKMPATLEGRAAYLRWQTRAVSDIYKLSGLTDPHIGGPVVTLTISSNGQLVRDMG